MEKTLSNFMDPERVKARTELRLKVDSVITEADKQSLSPAKRNKSAVRDKVAQFLKQKELEKRNMCKLTPIQEGADVTRDESALDVTVTKKASPRASPRASPKA